MEIYNGTSHAVNFYRREQVEFSSSKRRFVLIDDQAEPHLKVGCSRALSVQFDTQNYSLDGIPFKDRKIFEMDQLPEGYDIYIVSSLYAAQCRDNRVRTLLDIVFDSRSRIKGCLSLGGITR